MKKIWIFNHYATTPSEGGITRHYDFAKELVNRGYNVTIFASAYNHSTQKSVLYEDVGKNVTIENGITFVWINTYPKYKGNGIKRILNMISYFWEILRIYKYYDKPEIIIGSSVHLFAPLAAHLICKKIGAKFICEIRDLWPQSLIDMGAISNNHPLAIFFRFIEKIIYKNAYKIITVPPNANDYIIKFGVDSEKIIHIPNGVNIGSFDENLDKWGKTIDIIDKGTFNCTYTGAHGVANKLDNILNAASIIQGLGISNIRFYLVGDGPEKDKLINYSNKLGLKNITFINHIDKKYIPGILDASDLLIFNLRDANVFKYGISPNKLFDYMCASKPIVYACKSQNNIVEEANSGISVSAEDPVALANAIIDIYNLSEVDRQIIGKNGRIFVEKNHMISILVDKLEICFK